ncbi:MAG: HugZ family protein [Geminicoccales bacterium]
MAAADSPAATVRHLVRSTARAALGTVLRDAAGAPYVSLASVATDHDGAPLLLLSDLADHTRNLGQDDRASLLFDGTGVDRDDPLAGERVTLQGRLARTDLARHRARYLARHPAARMYADFGDFGFYRLAVERAHLVAGFGRIHWLDGAEALVEPQPGLCEREADIVTHMNAEHQDAVQLYATRLLGLPGGGWQLTGVDPEGCDLRWGNNTARLAFAHRVVDAGSARSELVRLAKEARAISPPA